MRYLGKIIGKGTLKRDGAADEPIGYDLDIFSRPGVGRTVSGEITASAETLRGAFEQRNLRVQIEDGSQINLFFDESTLKDGSIIAHVASRGMLGATQRADPTSNR
jgi:NADH:ubiquinone oxidoreductase subunit F (NADH-binding)